MKLQRSDITAFLALAVSLGALFVSIIEAQIMRDQQEIMQVQQKAAVYPYLTQKINLSLSGDFGYTHTILNKGVGPAKIKNTIFYLNGEVVEDYLALQKKLQQLFPVEAQLQVSYSDPSNYFISPKEVINVLDLQFQAFEGVAALITQLNFNVEFCYCSIFEDCWFSKEKEDGSQEKCH